MEITHPIHTDQRNGNLHVNLHGHFTPEIAAELPSTIARLYRGTGNIFIHTAKVTAVTPGSRSVFAHYLQLLDLPREKMYLTGIKGLDISPDKGRVIVYEKKKKGCCGRCRDCSCHGNINPATR